MIWLALFLFFHSGVLISGIVFERLFSIRGYFFLPLLLPALLRAIATACFCGFPCFISVLIFCEITFLLEPFFSGILLPRTPDDCISSQITQTTRECDCLGCHQCDYCKNDLFHTSTFSTITFMRQVLKIKPNSLPRHPSL